MKDKGMNRKSINANSLNSSWKSKRMPSGERLRRPSSPCNNNKRCQKQRKSYWKFRRNKKNWKLSRLGSRSWPCNKKKTKPGKNKKGLNLKRNSLKRGIVQRMNKGGKWRGATKKTSTVNKPTEEMTEIVIHKINNRINRKKKSKMIEVGQIMVMMTKRMRMKKTLDSQKTHLNITSLVQFHRHLLSHRKETRTMHLFPSFLIHICRQKSFETFT